MNNIIGKPYALKQVNLSIVRKTIKEKGSATRAEIVEATKISVTTVRTLLTEMLENNEITDAGYDESIGGRKAVRYKLNKDRFFAVALCLGSTDVRYLTVNICGEVYESGTFAVEGTICESVCSFLDGVFAKMEIKSIGIGVPGIVKGLEYQRKNTEGQLESYPIGEFINQRYAVPVFLENDIKAAALGFGRFFQKQYPDGNLENMHMAFIHFDKDCLNAGFLSGGRILRGWSNFGGELGLFPADKSGTLDDILASSPDKVRYADIVAKLIAGICCVLNPQYVVLGGGAFRKDCLPLITGCFNNTLPDKMSPEIIYMEDIWRGYFEGMAYLTAEQIFADVVLVKE